VPDMPREQNIISLADRQTGPRNNESPLWWDGSFFILSTPQTKSSRRSFLFTRLIQA
jgi:hypothetical protein